MRRKFDPSRKALLDGEERRRTFPADTILSRLPLLPDQTVADIGCGTGYFSIPLAERLTRGKVYALDISEEMLSVLRGKLEKSPHSNIVVLKSEEDKIPLKARSLDGVLMTCVLHEASEDRAGFLNKVFNLLKPNGWLAVVEWFKKEMPVGPPLKERLDLNEAIDLAPKEGVNLVKQEALSDKHYFLLWRKDRG